MSGGVKRSNGLMIEPERRRFRTDVMAADVFDGECSGLYGSAGAFALDKRQKVATGTGFVVVPLSLLRTVRVPSRGW